MGGMVLETNMSEILTHIEAQNKLEKSEVDIGRKEESFLCIVYFPSSWIVQRLIRIAWAY